MGEMSVDEHIDRLANIFNIRISVRLYSNNTRNELEFRQTTPHGDNDKFGTLILNCRDDHYTVADSNSYQYTGDVEPLKHFLNTHKFDDDELAFRLQLKEISIVEKRHAKEKECVRLAKEEERVRLAEEYFVEQQIRAIQEAEQIESDREFASNMDGWVIV